MATEPTITSASKTGTNDDNVIFGEDQTEAQRLDMQHQVVFDSMPQLVTAPIDLSKGGLKILDQATGSGKQYIDIRSQFKLMRRTRHLDSRRTRSDKWSTEYMGRH